MYLNGFDHTICKGQMVIDIFSVLCLNIYARPTRSLFSQDITPPSCPVKISHKKMAAYILCSLSTLLPFPSFWIRCCFVNSLAQVDQICYGLLHGRTVETIPVDPLFGILSWEWPLDGTYLASRSTHIDLLYKRNPLLGYSISFDYWTCGIPFCVSAILCN